MKKVKFVSLRSLIVVFAAASSLTLLAQQCVEYIHQFTGAECHGYWCELITNEGAGSCGETRKDCDPCGGSCASAAYETGARCNSQVFISIPCNKFIRNGTPAYAEGEGCVCENLQPEAQDMQFTAVLMATLTTQGCPELFE